MGSMADDFINGYFCETCGCYLDGEEPGHPRICGDCADADPDGIDGREVVKTDLMGPVGAKSRKKRKGVKRGKG